MTKHSPHRLLHVLIVCVTISSLSSADHMVSTHNIAHFYRRRLLSALRRYGHLSGRSLMLFLLVSLAFASLQAHTTKLI